MIVLDTNVVSELIRQEREPDPGVLAWVRAHPAGELFITAVTAAELLYGVERLPAGRRRAALGVAVGAVLATDFAGRVLPFGVSTAVVYGGIVADRERLGRPIGTADALIAATAIEAGAETLLTRNAQDFEKLDLRVVNPWRSVT